MWNGSTWRAADYFDQLLAASDEPPENAPRLAASATHSVQDRPPFPSPIAGFGRHQLTDGRSFRQAHSR